MQFNKPAKNSGLNGGPPTGFGSIYSASTLLSGHELLICNTDRMNQQQLPHSNIINGFMAVTETL